MDKRKACGAKRPRSGELLAKKKPNTLEMATGETDCEKLWMLRREFSNSLRATGLTKLNEDVVVPRSHVVDLIEFAEKLQAKHGFPIACFGHAGDGNIHVNLMAKDYADPKIREQVDRALDDLFEQVLAWGGVITGEHGIGLAKKHWWPEATSEVARDLHRKLKEILDPDGILNPGKFSGLIPPIASLEDRESRRSHDDRSIAHWYLPPKPGAGSRRDKKCDRSKQQENLSPEARWRGT